MYFLNTFWIDLFYHKNTYANSHALHYPIILRYCLTDTICCSHIVSYIFIYKKQWGCFKIDISILKQPHRFLGDVLMVNPSTILWKKQMFYHSNSSKKLLFSSNCIARSSGLTSLTIFSKLSKITSLSFILTTPSI